MIELTPIIPRDWPLREEAYAQLHHRDLPAMNDVDLWAEREVLALSLARRLSRRCRDRLFIVDVGDSFRPIPESDWLIERLRLIEAERKARRRRGGRR